MLRFAIDLEYDFLFSNLLQFSCYLEDDVFSEDAIKLQSSYSFHFIFLDKVTNGAKTGSVYCENFHQIFDINEI